MNAESPRYRLRPASDHDRHFVIEMARLASTLEGRPLPSADDPGVVALLPHAHDATIVAQADVDLLLGAAWWVMHERTLVRDVAGQPLPELVLAVVEEKRGEGIGGALIDALAKRVAGRFDALTLNVHLLNPAVRLYMRTGFEVAGAGRGRFGVAMIRSLAGLGSSRES